MTGWKVTIGSYWLKDSQQFYSWHLFLTFQENTIWVVSLFFFFFFPLSFFWDVKYPLDTNPTLSEEKAARSRPYVHDTLCVCSVRLPGCECCGAYTWQRRRWDSLGRRCAGWCWEQCVSGGVVWIECGMHSTLYMWLSHYVMTPCQCGAELCHFKTLRAGLLWH